MSHRINTSKVATLATIAVLAMPIALVRADNGPAHRIDQHFPISLGTSGGNINDRSKAFCYGGTLGALVEDANKAQYILSNNHVLARTNAAKKGEDIIQPGLIDQIPACTQDSSDTVGNLSAFVPIQFKGRGKTPVNTVDAAIAAVRSGAIDSTGRILDIGVISDTTLQPALGLAVKKSGRTTGLTTGNISAVDVTVDVSYGSGQTARFVNQILVTPGTFIDSGDSGSLMVADLDPMPRAVGLLFAGSSSVAIANPIDDVLDAFGLKMVGSSTTTRLTRKILDWAKNLFGVSESHAASAQLPSQVNPAALEAARKVKVRHEAQVMSVPGVLGVGIGHSDRIPGQAAIEVYVKEPASEMRFQLPNSLDGVEVKIVETGEIHAY